MTMSSATTVACRNSERPVALQMWSPRSALPERRDRCARLSQLDRAEQGRAIRRVDDPRDPRPCVGCSAGGEEVATDDERPILDAALHQRRARVAHRDRLDHPVQIGQAVGARRGEAPLRPRPPFGCQCIRFAHLGAGVQHGQRSGVDAAQLRIDAVQAEPGVGIREDAFDVRQKSSGRPGGVQGDHRAHRLEDMAHQAFAWSSADCTDCRYPSVVYVAPFTFDTWADCDASTSCRRIGAA